MYTAVAWGDGRDDVADIVVGDLGFLDVDDVIVKGSTLRRNRRLLRVCSARGKESDEYPRFLGNYKSMY